MAEPSISTLFQERFEFALQAYRKVTGVSLTEHPLAVQSVESITTVLKHEAQASSDFLGADQIIKSIENTVPVLHTLSSTVSIGEAMGLLRQNKRMGCRTFLTFFQQQFPPAKAILAGLAILLTVYAILLFPCVYLS